MNGDETKEQIRDLVDVVDLVSEYLELKGAGHGSFKAACPFHSEKTPSFHVSRQKQIWHCFGCDKGGDIFAFVMEMEGVGFREAMQILGDKAGVEIPKFERREDDNRGRLRAINGFAEAVFVKYLASDTGKECLDYLEGRGIDDDLRRKFGLGYAPLGWTSLVDACASKGIGGKEMEAAGLVLTGRHGFIDRFRNRMMVPLRDHHGNTVGFTGRVLDPEDSPKYMNSPQTEVYDKSSILYGLDLAKAAIKRDNGVVIVEGNLDVVASHKAGVENIVASSGTALTAKHINLLKRYTDNLIFAFDIDSAGFKAARRGMQLASSLGCQVRVAVIPQEFGKDPDDVVQKDAQKWRDIVSRHVGKMEFLFKRLVFDVDLDDVVAKRVAGEEFLPEIAALADNLEREHWIGQFAGALGLDLDVVRMEVLHYKDGGNRKYISDRVGVQRPSVAVDGDNAEKITEKVDKLLDLMFSQCIQDRESFGFLIDSFGKGAFFEGRYLELYKIGILAYNSEYNREKNTFFEQFRVLLQESEPNLVPYLDKLALIEERNQSFEDAQTRDKQSISILIDRVKDRHVKKRRLELLSALRRAELEKDNDLISDLTRQIQALL